MIQKKIKIMLIEDNITDVILIERQIKKIVTFPEILHITDFDQLKDAIDEFAPDVILCDYQLNGFTGFEVLKYVSSLPTLIPFIFITGTVNDEEIAASTILNGATAYILKKHINILHEKLLPYFKKIVEDKLEEPLSLEHKRVFDEMQTYLHAVKMDNKVIRASYLEVKKALDKIKSSDKEC